MILPGGGLRLQTLGRLATQLFDSTLRTIFSFRTGWSCLSILAVEMRRGFHCYPLRQTKTELQYSLKEGTIVLKMHYCTITI